MIFHNFDSKIIFSEITWEFCYVQKKKINREFIVLICVSSESLKSNIPSLTLNQALTLTAQTVFLRPVGSSGDRLVLVLIAPTHFYFLCSLTAGDLCHEEQPKLLMQDIRIKASLPRSPAF